MLDFTLTFIVPTLAEEGEPLFSMDNILGILAIVLVTFGGVLAAWWAKVKGKFGGGDPTGDHAEDHYED